MANEENMIQVEVAYAATDKQLIVAVNVPAGTTAKEAVEQSNIARKFPELDSENQPMGIFGHQIKASQVLREGDRVELYRPLLCDPKEVRRRRAKK